MPISSLLTTSQYLLQNFIINQGFTSENFTLAFGNGFNHLALENLAQQLIQGDFSSLPTVDIKSQSELGGANGVYVAELNKIFLAQEFIDNAPESQIIAVILEEYVHGIDHLINFQDSQGDEGFIFSALVRGESLTDEQLALARAENDQVEVVIDRQVYQAEANTSLVVDTLVDENDGIGVGGISLREALGAIADGGTITFADSIANGTIILNGTELVINKSVTIDGDTDNITVSGNNNSRVFNIDDGDSNTQQVVNISGLTITQGNSSGNGGGINNSENLTLSHSTVSGNSASGNGGGINNVLGTTNISSTTVSGNSAAYGGGILNLFGTMHISNTTVSGNSASDEGGGILNAGTTNISNSTVSGNSAPEGGGIYHAFGTTNISSSIVSGNSANSGDEVYGTVIANNNNLFGNSSQSNSDAFVNFTPGANDINATTDGENVALDNILDPDGLQDNGGSNKTIALVLGSPATNAGNNDDNLSTDQRGTGFTRVFNQQSDIGAFESVFELEVNTLNDEDDGIADGEISLRDALRMITDGGTITFADSIANGTIILNGTELVIDKSVTIDGDTNNITVSGNNNSRVFNINDGDNNTQQVVNISGLTITQGNSSGNGGGIYNSENLTLSNSTVSGNSSDAFGGGILNLSGTTNISNSTVSDNSASFGGAGILNSGTTSISNSTVSGNSATNSGGGIFNLSGTTNISSSIVSGNNANSGDEIYGTVIANNNNLFGNSSQSNCRFNPDY